MASAKGDSREAGIVSVAFLVAALAGSAQAEVPAPRPVPTDLTIGCYYFPGHFNAARWAPMRSYGHPRPLLGYYRDGAPEVADWHIKWAVEHGISFFAFDWYYDHHTGRVGEHDTALDEGFLKARYRDRMRFAIFWCNEEGAGEAPYTREEMRLLGRVLGERYVRQPNYLRIEGRPALFISVPGRLAQSFGEDCREVLREVSRAAGLADSEELYVIAKQSDGLEQLKQLGFSACTAYNYAGDRIEGDGSPLRASYADMVEVYERAWKRVVDTGALPYIVPVSPGWDSRPWYGPHAFVRTDPTPTLYGDMCERAKRYVDPRLNMVIAECWNEFGEGSFLEPTEEAGFAALDVMREVFCRPGDWPANVAPPAEERAKWAFEAIPDDPLDLRATAAEGNLLPWGDMEQDLGWVGFSHEPAQFAAGAAYAGARRLVLPPTGGVKSTGRVGLAFGREYEVSAWVRCSPGATVRVTCALFGRDGRWLGSYREIGRTEAGEWTRVAGRLPAIDPTIGAIDVEFVASGGACYADEVSVTIAGQAQTETVFHDRGDSPEGWETFEGEPPRIEAGALQLRPGEGLKTRTTLPLGSEDLYAVSAEVRCDPMATIEFRSALFDERGEWLGAYLPVPAGSVSWDEWVEVMFLLAPQADAPTHACNLEFLALGGGAAVRNVRVVRGGRMERQ
jgi:hypothetical protein